MNETKLDYLPQVTAPRSDWSTTTRHRDDQPVFDKHFVRASESQSADKIVGSPTESRTTETSPVSDSPTAESVRSSEGEASTAAAPPEEVKHDMEKHSADCQAARGAAYRPNNDSAVTDDKDDSDVGDASTLSELPIEDDLDKVVDAASVDCGTSQALTSANEWNNNRADTAAADATETTKSVTTWKIGVQRATAQAAIDGTQPIPLTGDVVNEDVIFSADTVPKQGGAASLEELQQLEERQVSTAVPKVSPSAQKTDRLPSDNRKQTPYHKPATTDQVESKPSAAEQSTMGERQAENLQPNVASGEPQRPFDQSRGDQPRPTGTWQRVPVAIAGDIVQAEAAAATTFSKLEAPEVMANEAIDVEANSSPDRPSTSVVGPRSYTMLNAFMRLPQAGSHVDRSDTAAGGERLPPVDAARFVGRVARAFHTAQERGGSLRLRLSPPELGAVRLELMVKDGVLAATLETETPAARRVLLDHLPALRDRLIEQNIRIERFDVDVRRDGSGNQQSSTPQQQREHQPTHWFPPRSAAVQSAAAEETPSSRTNVGVRASDSQINLVA
jgi:flagellar hook-length control protein FliK